MSIVTSSSYTDREGVVHCGDCDLKIEDCFCLEALNYHGANLGADAESLGTVGATVEEEFSS